MYLALSKDYEVITELNKRPGPWMGWKSHGRKKNYEDPLYSFLQPYVTSPVSGSNNLFYHSSTKHPQPMFAP
jgi:hypothetical protein